MFDPPRVRQSPAPKAELLADALFLTAIVALSALPYINGLGFYSDDWAFFGHFHASNDQSVRGLFWALYDGDVITRQRPVQDLVLAALYSTFGLHALGYHLFNVAVLAVGAVLLYLVVREVGQPRWSALAVPAVWMLLPNASTARFWVAAFQITVSMTLYLASVYAALRAVGARPSRVWAWTTLSAAAFVVAGLAYELILPLAALTVALLVLQARRLYGGDAFVTTRWQLLWPIAATIASLAAVVVFKAATTVRLSVEGGIVSRVFHLYVDAAKLNFGKYIGGVPFILVWIARHALDPVNLVAAALVGAVVFAWLWRARSTPGSDSRRGAVALILFGLAVFVLGYAIFVTNSDTWFTSTSLGNRIGFTASAGVAAVIVGAIALLVSYLSPQASRIAFVSFIALVAGAGTLMLETLADDWAEAYDAQQQIMRDLRTDIPSLDRRSAVLLSGVCVEQGAAYVFTGNRDVRGRLVIAYDDPTLRGSTVRAAPTISPRTLSVLNFRNPLAFTYDRLFVYDHARRRVDRLRSAAEGRRYFASTRFDCPPIFEWGLERGGLRAWLHP